MRGKAAPDGRIFRFIEASASDQAAIGIDQATSRVKAGSGKSARAAQRDALKAPTVYRFKNLLCDEDGRTIQ